MDRKPFALSNWKMAMTLAESRAFVRDFRAAVGDLVDAVDIVLCPPYTALYIVGQALLHSPIALGAQDVCAATGLAHTGQVSAPAVSRRGMRVGDAEPLGDSPP